MVNLLIVKGERMNKNLQEAIAKLINESIQIFDKTGEFLDKQIPDVVEQLLLWHCIESFIIFFSWELIFLFGFHLYFKHKCRLFHEKDITFNNEELYSIVCMVVGAFMVFVGFIVVSTHLEWLQILVAPKMFLIDYATEILK